LPWAKLLQGMAFLLAEKRRSDKKLGKAQQKSCKKVERKKIKIKYITFLHLFFTVGPTALLAPVTFSVLFEILAQHRLLTKRISDLK
jgi:hypothetical protein